VSASVGFIALFGVAVLNGLVLLTTIQRRREGGRA
jgi:cobalt-zinc-cadmium resistance protein CzcA